MGVAAFWIALAAVIISSHWRGKAKEQMRHETVRLLLEKEGSIDQAQIERLLYPKPPPLPANHPWLRRPDPAGAYKAFRIIGTVLIIVAPGVALMVAGIGMSQGVPQTVSAALGIAAFLFLLGIAFVFVSRFVAPVEEREDGVTRDT